MTKNYFLVCIAVIFSCHFVNAQKNNANEGVLLFKSSMGSDTLTTDKIWFKDSMVIYEFNAPFRAERNDSVILQGYETEKYIFFDLRTLGCQDYYSFSDTATIEFNYGVIKDDPPGWDFFNGGRIRSLDSTTALPDTVIGKKHYKRILYKEFRPEYNYLYHETQYWLCNEGMVPIMHIEKQLEERMMGCRLEKRTMQQLMPPDLLSDSSLYVLERNYLTKEEKKIFIQWEKNARITKLPVSSKREALIRNRWPIKYRNHPYVKEFMKWEAAKAAEENKDKN